MPLSRRALLAVLPLALLGRGFRALAAEAVAMVVATINGVNAARPGHEPEPLPPDSPIEPGTEIATDQKSAAQLAVIDGSVITLGAGVKAIIGSGDHTVLISAGSLRFRTGAGAPREPALATPALQVALHDTAEMIVTVAKGSTTCGVVKGRITCSSIKKGTQIELGEGQSVRWGDGSFGAGVMETVYLSGDIAVDDGMEAARAAYGNVPTAPPP